MNQNKYIKLSLELHLFFDRIMKEHSLFLGAAFMNRDNEMRRIAQQFEQTFSNILKVRLPKTIRLDYYTNCDKKVSMKSKDVGSLALASSINELACAITGEDEIIEEF